MGKWMGKYFRNSAAAALMHSWQHDSGIIILIHALLSLKVLSDAHFPQVDMII